MGDDRCGEPVEQRHRSKYLQRKSFVVDLCVAPTDERAGRNSSGSERGQQLAWMISTDSAASRTLRALFKRTWRRVMTAPSPSSRDTGLLERTRQKAPSSEPPGGVYESCGEAEGFSFHQGSAGTPTFWLPCDVRHVGTCRSEYPSLGQVGRIAKFISRSLHLLTNRTSSINLVRNLGGGYKEAKHRRRIGYIDSRRDWISGLIYLCRSELDR